MAMKQEMLLPGIIKNYDLQKPWEQWSEGTVLFADVSGFTPMSEKLSQLGPEGAEILTDILNRYFKIMIDLIHQFGGDVMKFGGDAILCFFEGTGSYHPSLKCAFLMQDYMNVFQKVKTAAGNFSLKMKIGLSFGEVLIGAIGDPFVRCDYFFAGKPVDLATDAEHCAKSGEIIAHQPEELISQKIVSVENRSPGFYKILSVEDISLTPAGKGSKKIADSSFFVPEISEMVELQLEKHIGSLQNAVVVFLLFQGMTYNRESFNLNELDDFFKVILDVTRAYQGRLNRISMGDKGSSFMLLFGAPNALEKKEELAALWAIKLKKDLQKKFPHITIQIGMNAGLVFSGLVGASNRYDYTVMGDTVNFAARLMQSAQNGQIIISSAMYRLIDNRIRCRDLGSMKFKGKKEALPRYEIVGEKEKVLFSPKKSPFFGRKKYLNYIQSILQKTRAGGPAMVVIEGEAGIGKTALAEEILHWAKRIGYTAFRTGADITTQNRMYYPWSRLFEQLGTGSLSGRQGDPTRVYTSTEGLPMAFDSEHSATRKKQFHHDCIQNIPAIHENKPSLFFFDDLHFFDSQSLEMLETFLNTLVKQPVLILSTTRPAWEKDLFINRNDVDILVLDVWDRSTIRIFAQTNLGSPPHDGLVGYLLEQTGGNPFYVQTLLAYLKNENLLEKHLGKYQLADAASDLNFSDSSEIITSQFLALKPAERVVLRDAACIGNMFPLALLKGTMGRHFTQSTWTSLISKGYIKAESEDTYAFQHALWQDIVYRMVPYKTRRIKHRRIGKTIELIYEHELETWYPNLANHFHLGENRKKATDYAIISAKQLYSAAAYKEACHFAKRAFQYLKFTSDPRKLDVGLNTIELLIKTCKYAETTPIFRTMKHYAAKKNNWLLYLRYLLIEFDTKSNLADYSFLPFLKRILARDMFHDEKISTQDKIQMLVIYGVTVYQKGLLYEAENLLEQALEMASEQMKHSDSSAKSYSLFSDYRCYTLYLLASIARKTSRFERALTLLDAVIKDRDSSQTSYLGQAPFLEKASLLTDLGMYHEAITLYNSLLPVFEKIGDIQSLGTAHLNMAHDLNILGDVKSAFQHLEEALILFQKIGNKRGLASTINFQGTIEFGRGNFSQALKLYLDSLELQLACGNEIDLAELYYNLTEVNIHLGNRREAVHWLHKLEEIVTKIDVPFFMEAYESLTEMLQTSIHRDR